MKYDSLRKVIEVIEKEMSEKDLLNLNEEWDKFTKKDRRNRTKEERDGNKPS